MSYSFWRMEMAILIWDLWFDQIEVVESFLEIRKVAGVAVNTSTVTVYLTRAIGMHKKW
jgi:hypothetical protein